MKRALALALLVLLCAPALPTRADIAVPWPRQPRVAPERPPVDAVVIRVRPVWNQRGNSAAGASVDMLLEMSGPCDYSLTLHHTGGQRPDIRHQGRRTEPGPYTARLALDVPALAAGEVVEYGVDARVTPHISSPRGGNNGVLMARHTLVFAGEQGGEVGLYFDGKPMGRTAPGAGAANGQERGN